MPSLESVYDEVLKSLKKLEEALTAALATAKTAQGRRAAENALEGFQSIREKLESDKSRSHKIQMTYYIDINESETHGRTIIQNAASKEEALELAHKHLEGEEFVYQIRREIKGYNLPQPVYDYMNGFMIYQELDRLPPR